MRFLKYDGHWSAILLTSLKAPLCIILCLLENAGDAFGRVVGLPDSVGSGFKHLANDAQSVGLTI